MSVNINFGQYHNYEISESRLSKMLEGNRTTATDMSLWEKFKDLFRIDKKSDAYHELYNMIHDANGCDKLDAFNKLKSFAKIEHQELFKKEIFCNDIVFFIGNERIGDSSIQKLINVSEQTPLISMSSAEQSLFLEMLDTLRENESQFIDRSLNDLRIFTCHEHCYSLLDLYRPQEAIDDMEIEWKMAGMLTKDEEDLLRYLNSGNMTSFNQFSSVGYNNTESDVEFTMVHPLISFLGGTYTKDIDDVFSFTDVNSEFLNGLTDSYQNYHNNKLEVDKVLKKIYERHGNTLNISYLGQNGNKLSSPVEPDFKYEMQGDTFFDDVNKSLTDIMNKWTSPNVNFSQGLLYSIHDTDL